MIGDALNEINRIKVIKNGHLGRKEQTPKKLSHSLILSEINDKTLKELTESVLVILERIQTNNVDREQAMLELAAHRQLIQLLVLDYNRRIR